MSETLRYQVQSHNKIDPTRTVPDLVAVFDSYTEAELFIKTNQGHDGKVWSIVGVKTVRELPATSSTPSRSAPVAAYRDQSRPLPTEEEVDRAQTAKGGWLRKDTDAWGVPYPRPSGWRKQLMAEIREKERFTEGDNKDLE